MTELFADAKPSLKTVAKEKFILDATAGFRQFWFDKKHSNCIYLDQRPECEPDIVGDFRDLSQFEDNRFRLVVFDPPHIIKKLTDKPSNMERDYGSLRPETWQTDLQQAFHELYRVLAPMGILLFKWNTTCKSGSEIMKLFPMKPLIYQISQNKHDTYPDGKRQKSIVTLWFCFMKIPEQTEASLSK